MSRITRYLYMTVVRLRAAPKTNKYYDALDATVRPSTIHNSWPCSGLLMPAAEIAKQRRHTLVSQLCNNGALMCRGKALNQLRDLPSIISSQFVPLSPRTASHAAAIVTLLKSLNKMKEPFVGLRLGTLFPRTHFGSTQEQVCMYY